MSGTIQGCLMPVKVIKTDLATRKGAIPFVRENDLEQGQGS